VSAQVSWERNAKYQRLARDWDPFLPGAKAGLVVTTLSRDLRFVSLQTEHAQQHRGY